MKLKVLLLALFTAGLAVSLAVAAPAAIEKGKPGTGATSTGTTSTGTTTDGTSTGAPATEKHRGDRAGKHEDKNPCRPARKVLFHGEFVAAADGGFTMSVTKGNRGAKPFVGKQATVLVDERTRFHGKKRALADLVAGDRLVVQAHACKADGVAGSLLARKVGVKGASSDAGKDEAKKDDADDDSTATETTTAP